MSVPNVPFGPGFDESNATAFASQMAALIDQCASMTEYGVDTYSPFSSTEIAAYWATTAGLDAATPEMEDKANKFKSWLQTVQAWVDQGMSADVGYQIKGWRSGAPYPPFR